MSRCPALMSLPRARLLDRDGWPASLVAHVDGCARCRAELEAWRAATALLVEDAPDLDAAALARVERQLRAAAEPRGSWSPRWSWGAAALAGAAVLVVALRASTPGPGDGAERADRGIASRVAGAPDSAAGGASIGASPTPPVPRASPTIPSVGALALDPVRPGPASVAEEEALAPAAAEASEARRLRLAAGRHAPSVDDSVAPAPPAPAARGPGVAPDSSPSSPTALDVHALLARADDARRRRDTRAAIEAYEEVAARADGAAFAEEALLRAARLRVVRGELEAARVLVTRLRTRFPDGALAPERRALEAALDDVKVEPGTSAQ